MTQEYNSFKKINKEVFERINEKYLNWVESQYQHIKSITIWTIKNYIEQVI